MNTRQMQYAVLLSEIRNFSQVADKLKISQPALSKQIINLENEVGVKLFDRDNSPIALTPAGEFFIREAKDILYKEKQLKRAMQSYKDGESGELIIGITPFRSSYMIAETIQKVRERFPNTTVRLQEASSDTVRKEVIDGKYDFAIVNLPVNDAILSVMPLEPDKLVLVVPNSLAGELSEKTESKEIQFSACKDLPFVVVGISQEMRQLFENLCASSGFVPKIAAETVSLTTAWNMVQAGIGATILPWQFIESKNEHSSMTIFNIANSSYSRQAAIVMRRDQFCSQAAEYAISLLLNK